MDGEAAVVVLREYRPGWELHAALRFASIPYQSEPRPIPTEEDALGGPELVDGSVIASTAAEALRYIDRLAAPDTLLRTEDLGLHDQAALEGILALSRSVLEPLALFVEFVADPMRSEAPEQAHTPLLARWVVHRARTRAAAAHITEHELTREDQAQEAAERAYRALAIQLRDKDFLFGGRPSIADALVFAHLQRVRGSIADAWLESSSPAAGALIALRERIIDRYFGGSASATAAASYWAPLASELLGEERPPSAWWRQVSGGSAVIIIAAIAVSAIWIYSSSPAPETGTRATVKPRPSTVAQ